MEERKSVFGYLAQIFMIYGIMTLLLNVFCLVFGNVEEGYSAMFSLGSKGISVATSMQYFGVAILTTLYRFVFCTDTVIKNMPVLLRVSLMLIFVVGTVSAFIVIFKWFPVNAWEPWVLFVFCFAVSFIVSGVVVTLKEKLENKRMEEALLRYKEENKVNE